MAEVINWAWSLACRAGLHGCRRTIHGYRRGCQGCARHGDKRRWGRG